MVRFGQLVIGPAGSGKSTYCSQLQKYCEDVNRTIHVVNLDPVCYCPWELFLYYVFGYCY